MRTLIATGIAFITLWGCSKGPATGTGQQATVTLNDGTKQKWALPAPYITPPFLDQDPLNGDPNNVTYNLSQKPISGNGSTYILFDDSPGLDLFSARKWRNLLQRNGVSETQTTKRYFFHLLCALCGRLFLCLLETSQRNPLTCSVCKRLEETTVHKNGKR